MDHLAIPPPPPFLPSPLNKQSNVSSGGGGGFADVPGAILMVSDQVLAGCIYIPSKENGNVKRSEI